MKKKLTRYEFDAHSPEVEMLLQAWEMTSLYAQDYGIETSDETGHRNLASYIEYVFERLAIKVKDGECQKSP
jgi:hypothetical protein